jgi:hypothetical protein
LLFAQGPIWKFDFDKPDCDHVSICNPLDVIQMFAFSTKYQLLLRESLSD